MYYFCIHLTRFLIFLNLTSAAVKNFSLLHLLFLLKYTNIVFCFKLFKKNHLSITTRFLYLKGVKCSIIVKFIMMFLPSIFGADILKCHWEGVKVFCLYSFQYLWTHFRYVSINVCYSFYYLKIIFVINKLSFETCPFPFCIKIMIFTKVIENREDF